MVCLASGVQILGDILASCEKCKFARIYENDPSFWSTVLIDGFRPITNVSPASSYVGIDQSIEYGSTTLLNLTAGITDTGTTLLLLATGSLLVTLMFEFSVTLSRCI